MTIRIADDFAAINRRMKELAGIVGYLAYTKTDQGTTATPQLRSAFAFYKKNFSNQNGFTLHEDRRWLIHTLTFSAVITDYNWELTSYDPRLAELEPDVFVYGGNAHYILGPLSKKWGWTFDEIPRTERCSSGT